MQEKSPNKTALALTQPPNWTGEELALLDRIAAQRFRKADLLALFPGRTIGAIRVRLSRARGAQGIVSPNCGGLKKADKSTTMLDPRDPGLADDWHLRWRKSAMTANGAFLEAVRLAA